MEMRCYRQLRAPNTPATAVAAPLISTDPTESWQSMASQYGLADMTLDTPDVVEATVDEEYAAYMASPLTCGAVNLVGYWEVCTVAAQLLYAGAHAISDESEHLCHIL